MTPLPTSPGGHNIYATMSEELAEAVRELLDEVPGSDNELAQRAGVPQSTLSRIRTGERGCSREVAETLADTLGQWADDCREAESNLRRALQREQSNG